MGFLKLKVTKYLFGTAILLVLVVLGFQNCGAPMNQGLSGDSLASTSTTGTVTTCTGTYTFTPGNGTLSIVTEDSYGNITGSLNVGSINGTLTGTCINSAISFTRTYSGEFQDFTGTITGSQMSGSYTTYTTGGSMLGTNTWSATLQ